MSETPEEFAARAEEWLAANMPLEADAPELDDIDAWNRTRELQAKLYAGGFAGICYPAEYGGLGLDPAYQRAFNRISVRFELPRLFNANSLTINTPTILDHGTEEQKQQHIRSALKGEGVYIQLLSEPNGGSNLAGVITRAERDGETWVLNGSKIWSSFGYAADYGMCLARTDWDAPKHRGLTMFLVPLDDPRVNMSRIEMTNGSREFCQEFLDDLVLGPEHVLGEVNGGWSVATTLIGHERLSLSGGSPYMNGYGTGKSLMNRPRTTLVQAATQLGLASEPWARELVGRAETMRTVNEHLVPFVVAEATEGRLAAGGVGGVARIFHAEVDWAETDAGLELVGAAGVSRGADSVAGDWGKYYLSRQGGSLGGGSTEMSRNGVAERLLQMPRDEVLDKDVPFREVRQGR